MRVSALALALALACSAAAGPRSAASAPLALSPLAGDLPVETLAGAPRHLGGPGPVRVVELWATWCEPCAAAAARAAPVLARHPRVVAYAVALDPDRDAVARHLVASPPLGEPLLLRGGPSAAARRGHDQIPAFFVLDARGREVGSVTGSTPNLGPRLERLLRLAEGDRGEPR